MFNRTRDSIIDSLNLLLLDFVETTANVAETFRAARQAGTKVHICRTCYAVRIVPRSSPSPICAACDARLTIKSAIEKGALVSNLRVCERCGLVTSLRGPCRGCWTLDQFASVNKKLEGKTNKRSRKK